MTVTVVQEIPLCAEETPRLAIIRVRRLLKTMGANIVGPAALFCTIHPGKAHCHHEVLFQFRDFSLKVENVCVIQRGDLRSARIPKEQIESFFYDCTDKVSCRGIEYRLGEFSFRLMMSHIKDDITVPIIELQCHSTVIPAVCSSNIYQILSELIGHSACSLPFGITRDFMCHYYSLDTYCQYTAIFSQVFHLHNIPLAGDEHYNDQEFSTIHQKKSFNIN